MVFEILFGDRELGRGRIFLSTLYLKKDENIPFHRAGRASRAVQVFLGPSMAPKNIKRIY